VRVRVGVCLDVNQGGTNRDRCTQRLVISRAQAYTNEPWSRAKNRSVGLLYGSKPFGKKWAWMGIFKPAEPHAHV